MPQSSPFCSTLQVPRNLIRHTQKWTVASIAPLNDIKAVWRSLFRARNHTFLCLYGDCLIQLAEYICTWDRFPRRDCKFAGHAGPGVVVQTAHPGIGVGVRHVIVEDLARIVGADIVTLIIYKSLFRPLCEV